MKEIAGHFTALDWIVVIIYLALTTWIGHLFKGKQATIRDFFLAGRTLPWPAVTGSIIATSISAITLVGVPATVYAVNGNFAYLQLAIGSIIARFIVAHWFVKAFYEREIYSPYDYISHKLGAGVEKLITLLFFLGAILGQGVRVYAIALVLQVVTGVDIWYSVVFIGIFSILWTWMGGMATVIWTDVVQFCVFTLGAITAFIWMIASMPEGAAQGFSIAAMADKFKLWDFSTDPRVAMTFWAGLLAMPFQNLAAYGTDQMNAQRMFCCRNAKEAGKAIRWSCVSEIITLLMLSIGAMLYAYYTTFPLSEAAASVVEKKSDTIFPIFIVTVLPPGLTGLLFAAIFAGAISSLDSILAALSQASLTTFYKPKAPNRSEEHYLNVSRLFIFFWGAILSVMAIALAGSKSDLINLAFGMTAYTYGIMLGIFLLAILPFRRDGRGLWLGIPLSLAIVWIFRHRELLEANLGITFVPELAWPWLFPLTCATTLIPGVLLGKKKAGG
jgi:solute:Na+ symporter, SSS family